MIKDNETVVSILRDRYEDLYSAEKKVANYILENPKDIIIMNVADVAKNSKVSDATVVRMCQHAGFKGYYQMRLLICRDFGQKEEEKKVDSKKDPIGYVFERELEYIRTLDTSKNKKKITKASKMIMKSKNVFVVAEGNTIPMALDLDFRLNRFGIKSYTSSIPEQYMNYINNGCKDDLIIAISKSGMSNRVNQAVELGKKKGLKVISITGDETSPLAKNSSCVIYSGELSNIFINMQYGLQTHIGEMIVIDILLYLIENMQNEEKIYASNNELELEMSSWKI